MITIKSDKNKRRILNNHMKCNNNIERDDFNCLACINGTCTCPLPYYLDGSQCSLKRNYTEPCNSTDHCRDFNPVNLVCRLGSTIPPALQCLCNLTSFWEPCLQQCTTSKRVNTSSAYLLYI